MATRGCAYRQLVGGLAQRDPPQRRAAECDGLRIAEPILRAAVAALADATIAQRVAENHKLEGARPIADGLSRLLSPSYALLANLRA